MSQDIAEVVRGVWCAVLDVEKVAVDDDFFALGGHSLSAMQVTSRLRERLDGARVPTRILFTHRTLGAFTEAVAQRLAQEVTA